MLWSNFRFWRKINKWNSNFNDFKNLVFDCKEAFVMADLLGSENIGRRMASLRSEGKSGQMQSLLGEFKGLYEGRLRRLDEAERSGEDTSKTRVRILQAYVNDLSEQNEVLVQTVEELEREANERVGLLESKLKQNSGSVKVLMILHI
ncbi:hypothetical protein KUTeg_018924 [Tegillarca granosa]|uniref:Uncharacterized protein n=1 Tax=Tegillarca granosa TaxID=220873 RepID=A0ABQ9EB17_TEGGR|nr:hypothetical protein KUTeg_018924 [Tegillarca granosa]